MESQQSTTTTKSTNGHFATAVHGNTGVSDSCRPVLISHLGDGPVVSPAGSTNLGIIHFPLPLTWLHLLEGESKDQVHQITELKGLLTSLSVDFVQVPRGHGCHARLAKIIKTEVLVGCKLYWCRGLNEESSFTVKIEDDTSGYIDLNRPKGLGVTLTIEWGENKLRFCSVALRGDIVKEKPCVCEVAEQED